MKCFVNSVLKKFVCYHYPFGYSAVYSILFDVYVLITKLCTEQALF